MAEVLERPCDDIAVLSDRELVESMKTARRLASQAEAVELAAVAELVRRRNAAGSASCARVLCPSEYVHDEVAAALAITLTAADDLIRFATELTERLPGTFAALARGDIDSRKARTVWYGTDRLDAAMAAVIEAAILPKTSAQTTGQIRAKIRRLVKKLDPDALQRRRAAAESQRSVQLVQTDDGTADLSGVDLPAEAASAAYQRIAAIATAMKNDGDSRGIAQLCADTFLDLLRGTLPAQYRSAQYRSAQYRSAQCQSAQALPAQSQCAQTTHSRAGGVSEHPADPGVSPAVQGAAVRTAALSTVAVGQPGWSAADDQVAEAIAMAARAELGNLVHHLHDQHLGAVIAQAGRRISQSLAPLKTRWCTPHRVRYRPSAAIRRLVEARDRRCVFPGCRRPVDHCDADHSIPFDAGGPTCPCNLALLCRRHHRTKQTNRWRIEHIWPGVILWITPTGHWSITAPTDRE